MGWQVASRMNATRALRVLQYWRSQRNDPQQYALHSEKIEGATHLARSGATAIQIQRAGHWQSAAFMVYVRPGGEGTVCVESVHPEHPNGRGVELL